MPTSRRRFEFTAPRAPCCIALSDSQLPTRASFNANHHRHLPDPLVLVFCSTSVFIPTYMTGQFDPASGAAPATPTRSWPFSKSQLCLRCSIALKFDSFASRKLRLAQTLPLPLPQSRVFSSAPLTSQSLSHSPYPRHDLSITTDTILRSPYRDNNCARPLHYCCVGEGKGRAE
ncbi:hypothetical protein MKEN_01027000 [Mycena kentingensis (nom. inval.)]|nr:hypothetical protein MKEN_01027000 [Mycena kentingensis (nom. inval.)]